ncbi:MAG: glycoside hydrolase family 5 protein [Chloroflexi bacterium]|nr:glycoside hydrolase family 5 protein [Chloroflexota bacterium]
MAVLLPACSSKTISIPVPTSTATYAVPFLLHRGINFGSMLEAPNEGEWGLFVQEEYFDLVKEAGFDFVRLPVRWNSHAEAEWPYTIDPVFFARVDTVIQWALERELTIIVDFHHYEEIMLDPAGHKERFLGIWVQVAEHYRDYPSAVMFELLNEPSIQFNAAIWNQYFHEALAIIRKTNPTRDVIVGPVRWNAYEFVTTLDIPNDDHIVYTFHYYLPPEFTLQGTEWSGGESEKWIGTTWEATDEQMTELVSHFDLVADWAKRHGNLRILLGEFGVYDVAPQESRVRWTEFVRREAERRGFAWAYWEFGADFGVYDLDTGAWRNDLLKALIP